MAVQDSNGTPSNLISFSWDGVVDCKHVKDLIPSSPLLGLFNREPYGLDELM
jgi:hypothetical protein